MAPRSNPRCLLAQSVGCLAADGETHPLHPIAHRPTQRHLAAAGTNRLRLQVKQDHPGARTIGHAKELDLAAMLQAARFHQ
jgi:hypothetical protein